MPGLKNAAKTVLICGDIKFAHTALERLSRSASVTTHKLTDKAAFLESCHLSRPTAIYRPLDTSLTIGKFDRSLLQALPKSVKFIAHNGAGYDQVDVTVARELDIRVSNTPEVVNQATATTALFLMIGAMRKFAGPLKSCHAGRWRDGLAMRADTMGRDPQNKTLGIVGMGGIGQVLARQSRAIGMTVQYHNRNRLSDKDGDGAIYVPDLDTLLKTSDVVSVNLPLNPATRHFISSREFSMMKDGAILINTARGPVVDEAALVDALETGKLAAAGLDVFEDEPRIHPGLLSSDKVIMLPHIGTISQETQKDLEELVIRNIISALETGRLETPVPEHAGF